jgi:hypothetical protein
MVCSEDLTIEVQTKNKVGNILRRKKNVNNYKTLTRCERKRKNEDGWLLGCCAV